jgi:hypothetical protein
VLEPAHPAPKVTVGAPEVNLRLAGSVSVNAMPARAGLVPVFARVKTSVVEPVSLIAAAPNVFATEGVPVVTTRHWSVATLMASTAVIEAARFVNAAGLPTHEALVCVATLVRPEMVTVHEAVPAPIAIPVNPERTRVPALKVALAGPEQPAL